LRLARRTYTMYTERYGATPLDMSVVVRDENTKKCA
jgi:hypothetical protein